MLKNIKGITMVALVITIILLLILVGISIVTLTGSGLFEKAILAEQKYKNSEIREEDIIGEFKNQIDIYSSRQTGTHEEKLPEISYQRVGQNINVYNSRALSVTETKITKIGKEGYVIINACWGDSQSDSITDGNMIFVPTFTGCSYEVIQEPGKTYRGNMCHGIYKIKATEETITVTATLSKSINRAGASIVIVI